MTTHTKISFLKSALRGVGFYLLIVNLPAGVGVLLFAELIGIVEECVI